MLTRIFEIQRCRCVQFIKLFFTSIFAREKSVHHTQFEVRISAIAVPCSSALDSIRAIHSFFHTHLSSSFHYRIKIVLLLRFSATEHPTWDTTAHRPTERPVKYPGSARVGPFLIIPAGGGTVMGNCSCFLHFARFLRTDLCRGPPRAPLSWGSDNVICTTMVDFVRCLLCTLGCIGNLFGTGRSGLC
jgi:hypothetical protein